MRDGDRVRVDGTVYRVTRVGRSGGWWLEVEAEERSRPMTAGEAGHWRKAWAKMEEAMEELGKMWT